MWSRPDRRFVARWIACVTLGEAAGFAVAASVAVAMIVLGAPPWVAVPSTVAAGAVEGALLASAQLAAMPASRPNPRAWVLATSGAAALAWTLGLLPSTLGVDLGSPVTWAVGSLGALVLLASIPVAQALVLRRRGAARWALVNACAWAVAVLWTAAPSPLIDERSPIALVVTLYVAAGMLMAVTVAVLTASTALRLFAAHGRGQTFVDGPAVDERRVAP